MALDNPADNLQIAQSAGRAFDVWFQVVLGIRKFIVALVLLLQLSMEKFVASPHVLGTDSVRHGRH